MRQKIKLKDQTSLSKWSVDEARELYNIPEWSQGFFDINDKGNMVVLPEKNKQRLLDIKEFVDGLGMRGLDPPILIRFTDILQKRIEEIQTAFQKAISEYNYGGKYVGVYPIKVNQQKSVVEKILARDDGRVGLEAGSKPELLAVLGLLGLLGTLTGVLVMILPYTFIARRPEGDPPTVPLRRTLGLNRLMGGFMAAFSAVVAVRVLMWL